MKDLPIDKFGSKMLVASAGVNKIPYEYLSQAFNCRCTGAGIIPRRGKEILTNSILGTNNKGGFLLSGNLYQVADSNVYEINQVDGTQTLIDALGYDARVDVVVYQDIAVIASEGQPLKVFDGTTITDATAVPVGDTGGILEYTRGYTFYAIGNILYISRPITAANPEYAYDFTGTGSQNIPYDTKITGLKGTLNGIYIFTEDKVEFIGANSLQNVAGSATFISTPLGFGGEPVNNLAIAASGDQIFYMTKNKQINTINYIGGTDKTTIGELSSAPVIGVEELLGNIDSNQPNGFAFQNQNDDTIQFHLRTNNYAFNNVTIVYDMINKTWAVDTGKNYNYIVKVGPKYYGYSDINTSIYEDDIGFSDNGVAIPFKIKTQAMNYGVLQQKLFGGMFTAGRIGFQTELMYRAFVDEKSVFSDNVMGNTAVLSSLGEIGGEAIGVEPIGGELNFIAELQPFEKTADQGRIYRYGTRFEIEISSISQIQNFLIDTLGASVEQSNHIDINNKF